MKYATGKLTVLAIVLSLVCAMLSACGGQPQQSGSSAAASASSSGQSSVAAASVDVAGWKTLGDVLSVATGNPAAGFDGTTYVAVFEVGDSFVRVLAKMDAAKGEKVFELDSSADDRFKQLADLIGDVEIESAEDITTDRIGQPDLDAYVGKTGQNLIDDGFTFADYYMYGGDETGAMMDKGYFSYGVVFDMQVSESRIGDEGAAIKDATVKSISYMSIANAATDLEQVG